MTRSLLEDAFAHHIWATLRLIDACLGLSPEQLATAVPGTYGSILETVRHMVGDDSWDLYLLTGEPSHLNNEDSTDLLDLRAVMQRNGAAWSRLLGQDVDPDTIVHEVDPSDGFQRHAPVGILLAHALHHGTDHRSQVCTALTALGIKPPSIGVFEFGVESDRSTEVLPTA